MPSLRHEWKHRISFADCAVLRSRLNPIMHPDPHAGPDGSYNIRSLYFDNPDDTVLREKLDGVNRREKFRIRYYNNDISRIFLEKKSKLNGLTAKESAEISQEGCLRLLSGDWQWLQKSDIPLFRALFFQMELKFLRPRAIVDYTREPFLWPEGNVRITIDRDLYSGLDAQDFLDPALPTIPVQMGRTAILEVKYDQYLPEFIRALIQLDSRQPSAFSKYAAARLI